MMMTKIVLIKTMILVITIIITPGKLVKIFLTRRGRFFRGYFFQDHFLSDNVSQAPTRMLPD